MAAAPAGRVPVGSLGKLEKQINAPGLRSFIGVYQQQLHAAGSLNIQGPPVVCFALFLLRPI